MKRSAIWLGLAVILASTASHGQERRIYEGVVDLKRKTIGTVILLDRAGGSLKGWMRLDKFVPIEGGSVSDNGAEFRAAGNRYEIDERKGKISYSGPDGEGSRFIQRLERLRGRFEELSEESHFSGVNIAAVEVEDGVGTSAWAGRRSGSETVRPLKPSSEWKNCSGNRLPFGSPTPTPAAAASSSSKSPRG